MRLNHLQISGFKSFPERADLAFDTGVTAIVGPNGCGKSNVIDAITWVLGEQSARSLRGERMEDVIFSGSDARRPTATAEVRLQLSHVTAALAMLDGNAASDLAQGNGNGNGNGNGANGHSTDVAVELAVADLVAAEALADERDDEPAIVRDVEVGRRLFRSGESEYLIDGQVCRLRDIQDLLMDSGVGIKAYAVIEQGKIGQILSARPMERRQLLEEAAGVTKYKSRRRAAELKLEAAQQNLTRVDDIVFEVEKQRSALKRQAAKARRYRRLRDELRRWEKVHFARKSQALSRAIEMAQQQLDDARRREEDAAARVASLESMHERMRTELAEADRAASAARDAAHAHELAVGRRQQQLEFGKQQIVSLTTATTDGETELRALEARRQPLQTELVTQQTAAQRCREELESSAEALRKAEEAYAAAQATIEGMEGDVEASRSEVFAAINSATLLRHVLDNAATALGRIDDELAKLEFEAGDVATESSRLASERAEVDAVVARVKERLDATRLATAERDAERATASHDRDAHVEQARLREHELVSMSARVGSLEELVTAREGYSDAARLVLGESSGALEHLGAVADHLDVDREHERAVEAGLDEVLQYVVVKSRADARIGMDLAREQSTGRCGFLIVDELHDEAPAPVGASLTPLSEVVRIGGSAADAIRHVLARVWLAPSFEAAAAAARTTTDVVVTPDGTAFRGAGIVRGGGRSGSRGILGTKGELKELHGRMESEREVVQHLHDQVAIFAAAAIRAETELKTLQTEEHAAEKALLEAQLRLERCTEERSRLDQRSDVVRTERRKAEEERDRLEAKRAEASDAISKLEADQRTADDRFMSAQRKLLETRESVDTLSQDVTEAKARYAALAERSAALEAAVQRLEEAAGDLDQRLMVRAADNQRTLEQQVALQGAIAESERQLSAEVLEFDTLRARVRQQDEHATSLRDQISTQEEELQGAREALESLHVEGGRLEVVRATADADFNNLASACMETLQVTLDQVRLDVEQLEQDGTIDRDVEQLGCPDDETPTESSESEAADDLSGAEEDPAVDAVAAAEQVAPPAVSPESSRALTADEVIATLREKIDRLGPVNMMAIDQFDELEQRFEFLTTQRQDLLDSIASTGEAIKRIDVTTRERFREAFAVINENLQRTFTTLFGGGRAGLVLLDEDDVLESGIDIIAQPPGKRLQSIQLLSGGEKALTAMALMFAIFRYKPSPFCLLDEIDAPLDEANIGRFVDMLRDMQDQTQFVLVTHSRKTMEIADRLYGVTMEEPGVSKLISVQLN